MKQLGGIVLALVFCTAAWADDGSLAGPELDPDDTPLPADVEWDWRPGDLIFRNGVNRIDESIKRSLGLEWASVGILRPGSGGPRVVHVDQAGGVTEDLLYEYVEGLSPGEYAAYRPRDLAPGHDPETDPMWAGPMAGFALFIAYGAPHDDEFLFGNGAFYNAELAYEAALNAAIVLGPPTRLRDLIDDPDDLDDALRSLLETHRYCRYELTFGDCWTHDLGDLSIVTTDSMIASGALDRVFP